MTTIGDKLKIQLKERSESALASARAKTLEEKRKLEAEEESISKFIELVKEDILYRVENNQIYTPIKVPETRAWGSYSYDNFLHNHKHRKFIEHELEWFKINGLKVEFSYRHDGVGINSWWVVEISPL